MLMPAAADNSTYEISIGRKINMGSGEDGWWLMIEATHQGVGHIPPNWKLLAGTTSKMFFNWNILLLYSCWPCIAPNDK